MGLALKKDDEVSSSEVWDHIAEEATSPHSLDDAAELVGRPSSSSAICSGWWVEKDDENGFGASGCRSKPCTRGGGVDGRKEGV